MESCIELDLKINEMNIAAAKNIHSSGRIAPFTKLIASRTIFLIEALKSLSSIVEISTEKKDGFMKVASKILMMLIGQGEGSAGSETVTYPNLNTARCHTIKEIEELRSIRSSVGNS